MGVQTWAMGLALLTLMATPAGAQVGGPTNERPYAWQSFAAGATSATTFSYELGVGTRDSRFFGSEGVEQGARLRLQPWAGVAVEASGGALWAPDQRTRGAGSVEVLGRVLSADGDGVDLDVGGGYGFDYRARHVLRARAVIGRTLDAVDLRLGGAVEVPLSGRGDAADLSLTLAGSVRVTPWWRQGVELGGEDLEGFWEEEEAEGGAKLLFGPTAYFTLSPKLSLRVHLAAVYSAGTGLEAGVQAARVAAGWGGLGRLSLAYTF